MERLIREGLRFGGLVRIAAPHLIARYNAALQALGLPPTALEEIHLDASGFSLEVAAEMDDMAYLDPGRINRRFIIVTPEQRSAPLVTAAFSVDAAIFDRFYRDNQGAIAALTLKDAIYGEIENLVFDVDEPADIVAIRKVRFNLYTPGRLLADARHLQALTQRFLSERDAWRDRRLMRDIVEGAKRCGDIRNNGIIPERVDFDWPAAFYSTHLGGTYVFRSGNNVLLVGDPQRLQPRTANMLVVKRRDGGAILDALDTFGLIEPFNPHWLIESGFLEQRLHMLVAAILGRNGIAFDAGEVMEERYLNRWIHRSIDLLRKDPAFRAIADMRALLGNHGDVEAFEAALDAELRLIFRRALPENPAVWEANRLINEFAEFDVITLFILNKPRFYELYEEMPEPMRQFAVTVVKRVYMPDGLQASRGKEEVRARLFGVN